MYIVHHDLHLHSLTEVGDVSAQFLRLLLGSEDGQGLEGRLGLLEQILDVKSATNFSFNALMIYPDLFL